MPERSTDIVDAFSGRLRALQTRVANARRGRRGSRAGLSGELTDGVESALEQLRVAQKELTAAREALESERLRYHDLFQFAPDGYLVTSARGRIQEANPAAIGLLNVPQGKIIGKPLLLYVEKDDRGAYLDVLRQMRGRDHGVWTIRLAPPRAAPIVAQVTAGAVRRQGGALDSMRWIIRNVSEQKRVEHEVEDHRTQLGRMAAASARAEERERRRIATAIHDRVSQTLAITKMKVAAIRELVPAAGQHEVDEATALLTQAVEETRTLTFELSPPVLYELGFVAAVEWLAEQVQRRHGLRVDVSARPLRDAPPACEVRVLLFHAVREFLSNAVRHARAKRVQVKLLLKRGREWSVTVKDDGRGFDASRVTEYPAESSGFGLFNIRTRLEQIGGRMEVTSKAGRETRVTVTAPAQLSQ